MADLTGGLDKWMGWAEVSSSWASVPLGTAGSFLVLEEGFRQPTRQKAKGLALEGSCAPLQGEAGLAKCCLGQRNREAAREWRAGVAGSSPPSLLGQQQLSVGEKKTAVSGGKWGLCSDLEGRAVGVSVLQEGMVRESS